MIAAKKMLLIGSRGGQVAFTTPGTHTWVAPQGVTSVCAVAVGGGKGSGGGLGWRNKIPVTPGQSYTVVVGRAGQNSFFVSATTVAGNAPAGNYGPGGTFVGDGGGRGGQAPDVGNANSGGGGAGGYTGDGGNGGFNGNPATSGSGGGGGGGAGRADQGNNPAGGGGVGILGQGVNGAAGLFTSAHPDRGGKGGSGGADGRSASDDIATARGGNFGGGGAIGYNAPAGAGAVRIIWGAGRAFPATRTGDV